MKFLPVLIALAIPAASMAVIPPAGAQPMKQPAVASLAQTERAAVDLRRGMSTEEVRTLLGKPRRTALRDVGGSPASPAQGTLHWLYSWDGSDRGSLRVDFVPLAAGAWTVASWEWAAY